MATEPHSQMPASHIVIDRARVEHVATLAALRLTASEAESFAHELAKIVSYVEELASLDTTDVPPTSDVHGSRSLERAPLRPDEVLPSLPHDEALAQAPRKDAGGFAVPAFVEGGQ